MLVNRAGTIRTIRVTHRYSFYASHRLHSPALTDEENRAVYGKCNNPFGHGHNYVLEVSIEGEPDPMTGLVVNRSAVDELVKVKVLQLFDHRNINMDVPEFLSLVPTTENVALVIAQRLERVWGEKFSCDGHRISRVHVQETDRNGFEVLLRRRSNVSNPVGSIDELQRVYA